MDFDILLSQIISGLAYGSIYAIFAIAIVLIYRANKILNIAITEVATFCVILMFFLLKDFGYGVSLLIALAASFVFGILLHLSVIRWVTEWRKTSDDGTVRVTEIMITIGLFYIFNNLSFFVFGDEPRPFPMPIDDKWISIGESPVSIHMLLILGFSFVLFLSVFLFFKFTNVGLILEAISGNPTSARLRGIRVSNFLALAWGISTVCVAMAGILVAPVLFLTPNMLIVVFGYAVMAVVIGGLESPLGALIGGLIIGVSENLFAGVDWIGTDMKFAAVFVMMLTFLVFRPRGLFGRLESRKI